MVFPTLKSLTSPDLGHEALPEDPAECEVLVEALIGPCDRPGEENFACSVGPPRLVERRAGPRSGRGLLIVPEFSWTTVRACVDKLLADAARETWQEVAVELNKELHWEFENYK